MAALSVATDQHITLIRKKDTRTRIALQTEQIVSVRKNVNTRRVAAIHVTSDEAITLHRRNETNVKATSNILHSDLTINNRRDVTHKRVGVLNVASENHLTLHRDTRLRERLAALEARVALLENTSG